MFGFLKKLFGKGDQATTPAAPAVGQAPVATPTETPAPPPVPAAPATPETPAPSQPAS